MAAIMQRTDFDQAEIVDKIHVYCAHHQRSSQNI